MLSRMIARPLVPAVIALFVAACTTAAPTVSAQPSPIRAALSAIAVLPVDSRTAEVVRAEVMRQLDTAPTVEPAYALQITTTLETAPPDSMATNGLVVLVTDFDLRATATREVLLSFGVRNEESYVIGPNPEVTARNRMAAEDRAALDAAALVVLHVAGTMETLLPRIP